MTDLHKPFDESLLSAYLDGELSAEARAQVEQAMQAELALREQLESLQRLQRELEPWRSEKLPHSIQARVMQRLGDAHVMSHVPPVLPPQINVHSRRRRTAWIGAVAATTAVAVIGWFMTLPNHRLADGQPISDASHAPAPSAASPAPAPAPLAPGESPQSPEAQRDQHGASESHELATLADNGPPDAGGGGGSLQFKLDRSEPASDHAALPLQEPTPTPSHVERAEDFLSWAFLRALPPDNLQPRGEPAQTVPTEQWSPEWQQLIANHQIQTVITVRTERAWDLASIQALYPQAKLELLADGHAPQPKLSPAETGLLAERLPSETPPAVTPRTEIRSADSYASDRATSFSSTAPSADSSRPLVEQSNALNQPLPSRVAVILDQRHPHYETLVAQLSGAAPPHDTPLPDASAHTREMARAAQGAPQAASESPSRSDKVEAAHLGEATSPTSSKVLLILEMPPEADEPH